MKQTLNALSLMLLQLCIVLGATAQQPRNNLKGTNERAINKMNLLTNRAAFIFNSLYENNTSEPALALYATKDNYVPVSNKEDVPISSTLDNKANEISEAAVCMFPNLTEDELWVKRSKKIEMNEEETSVEIYNSTGERVYYSTFNDNLHKINLCDFTAGTFLVKIGSAIQKIEIE